MKRASGLIILVVAFVVGFLSIRGTMPFMPIFGSSMEPTLQSGNLLLIEPIDPAKVKMGDIIVYNVPQLIREHYNYPPVVAHRVIKVITERGLSFRTKGDNTGEDPFSIRPGDIRGTVGNQISYLGLPLLFFQSDQGMIFILVALALLAFFLYSGELDTGRRRLQRGVFAPVIQESSRNARLLTQKMETTEQRMDATQQALNSFSAAVAEYAKHLASHTSAIQGLSEASHELKRGAAQQNDVLFRLMETMEQPKTMAEKPPKAERVVQELEKRTLKAETTSGVEKLQCPPGCAISRKALLKRMQTQKD